MVLVDTSILIDFFKGKENPGTYNFKEILKRNIPFGITSFIYLEVLQGALSENEFNILKEFLETQIFYEPDDKPTYEKAAKIYFKLRRKGETVRSTVDCLIAQIAKEKNLLLLHNDKDFDVIAKEIDIKIYT